MLTAAATGFATGFSLILAIGAQNAFVLRQGLLRRHVFWLCMLCAVSDAILIAAGVAGFGALVAALPAFPTVMAVAGGAFLIAYGAMRFRAAWIGGHRMEAEGQASSLRATLLAGAAFTWANPHVYLDTLGLNGAVSTQYFGAEKIAFGAGSATASFVFFFALGYGARLLAPLMQSVRAWQILDLAVAFLMWVIAAGLLRTI